MKATKYLNHLNRLLPSVNNASRSQNRWVEGLGLLGLCLYAFAYFFSKDICYIGEWIMVGAFILSLPHIWPQMKNDPLWSAFLLLLAYLCFKGISTYFIYGDPIADILDAIKFNLRFFWIFIVGWWLGGTPKALVHLLYLFLVGFIFQIVISFKPSLFPALVRGARVDFGIGPQYAGLYAATFLFIFSFLAKDFWGYRFKRLRISIWAVLVLVLSGLTIVTQTRAIWISMIAALIFSILSLTILLLKKKNLTKKYKINIAVIGTLVLLLISTMIVYTNFDILKKRSSMDFIAIQSMLKEDDNSINFSKSVTIRIELWKWAIDKIKQRPFFGWKIDNTSKDYLDSFENKGKKISKYHHVHNGFLEILLNQGVVGLFLLLYFPIYVVYAVWKMKIEKDIPYRFLMAFYCFTIICAIANMTTGHITSWVFWPYFIIFFGGFYSFPLWRRVFPDNKRLK